LVLKVFWRRRDKEVELEMVHLLQTMEMFRYDIGQQVSVVEFDAVVKFTNERGLPFFGNFPPKIG
jgi:hypothetical protein